MGKGKRDVGTSRRRRAVNLRKRDHGQGACARGRECRSRTRPTVWMRLREVDGRRCKPPFVPTSGTVAHPGGTLRRGLTEMPKAATVCVAACGTWVVCHTRSNSERSSGRGGGGGREECTFLPSGTRRRARADGSYLVDPASSHMLVSKIKPCMSKYKLLCIVKLRMAH